MELKFAHICLGTKDLEQTEHFYTEILGMEKVFEFFRDGARIGFYLRIADNEFIEVFEDKNAQSAQSIMLHLCLETNSIDQAQEALRRHGVATTEKIMGADNSYQIWFKDPNGLDIELHEYTKDSSQFTGADVKVNG